MINGTLSVERHGGIKSFPLFPDLESVGGIHLQVGRTSQLRNAVLSKEHPFEYVSFQAIYDARDGIPSEVFPKLTTVHGSIVGQVFDE